MFDGWWLQTRLQMFGDPTAEEGTLIAKVSGGKVDAFTVVVGAEGD
jgi:hypothetical protein